MCLFLPFPEPLCTLPPPFLHALTRRERTSLSLSSPIVTDSVLALRRPYQPFTEHDSGLMADRAIGFLQKRKRSSRKDAERAIGAAFVTLFISFSPFFFLLPCMHSFLFASAYTLTASKREIYRQRIVHTVVACTD